MPWYWYIVIATSTLGLAGFAFLEYADRTSRR